MQVLLAPQVSEKSTYVAEKNEQVVFRVVGNATKPEIKAAVELLFKSRWKACKSPTSRQAKALRQAERPAQGLEEGVRVPEARPGITFTRWSRTWHSSR